MGEFLDGVIHDHVSFTGIAKTKQKVIRESEEMGTADVSENTMQA